MNTEDQELENEELETEGPEVEGQETEGTETEGQDDFEERAKRMGWVPEDEFRGDKSRWVDAKTFVERGEQELPILRERLRKQDDQLKELREVKETVQSFKGWMTKAEERAYTRARKEIEGQLQAAKEAGDFDQYDQAAKELHKLETDAKPKAPEEPDPMKDPVFSAWASKNEWVHNDSEAAAYATAHGQFLNQTKPNLRGQEFLDELEKAVKKQFPEKFQNPRRNNAPEVESGGVRPRKSAGNTYDALPADAKRECDRFVKQKLLTKEEYVRDYFAQE